MKSKIVFCFVCMVLNLFGAESFEATKAAADRGDPKAQYELARCYAHGVGVTQNYTQAVALLLKSAQQGYAYAQTELAACYAKGLGVQTDIAEAADWYRKAALQGDALAEFGLGNLYFHGRGVAEDKAEALKWWRQAAEQNVAVAQDALGQYYFQTASQGPAFASKYIAAVNWLNRAAEQGYVGSMNNLAYLYENGYGVAQDLKTACRWYREAAEKNVAKAQSNLGLMYQEGSVVPRDFVEAYKWFKLSALQGDAIGRRYVEEYDDAHRLTPTELEKANQMVAEFRKQTRPTRPMPPSARP